MTQGSTATIILNKVAYNLTNNKNILLKHYQISNAFYAAVKICNSGKHANKIFRAVDADV